MMSPRLLFKLALLPLTRSWWVLGLMTLSFAQIMLALWFCGSVQKELNHTQKYARTAKFVTIQMKDETSPLDPIKDLLSGEDVSFEELKIEDTLKKMEDEEPEIVQSVRAIGSEGLQLAPKVLVVRGNVSDEALDKVKLMTEVYRVDATPVHHARMLRFYDHLSFELRISMLLILFLIVVQLLVFQRIQGKDSKEVMQNLLAWGSASLPAKIPGFASLLALSLIAVIVSIGEWFFFRNLIWKNNAFLGELSLEHSLSFPSGMVALTLLAIVVAAILLSFAGNPAED
jgi:hypothetical protein